MAHVELGGGEALSIGAGVDEDAVQPAHRRPSLLYGGVYIALHRDVAHGGAGQAELVAGRDHARLARAQHPDLVALGHLVLGTGIADATGAPGYEQAARSHRSGWSPGLPAGAGWCGSGGDRRSGCSGSSARFMG